MDPELAAALARIRRELRDLSCTIDHAKPTYPSALHRLREVVRYLIDEINVYTRLTN